MKPFFFEDEYCLIRETVYPLSHRHGRYSFSELDDVMALWNKGGLTHTLSAEGYEKSQLFFFDTETTGLGGGAGNMIFLLGHARVYEDRVAVKQHLLPKPGNETALYKSFLSEVDITSLVTYNGKAFDWPQVKTRHTLLRDRLPKLPDFGHFDLLHGARRLWKHKLERVSLSAVENEELAFKRDEDTPGYLAPMLYFQFLKAEDPALLKECSRIMNKMCFPSSLFTSICQKRFLHLLIKRQNVRKHTPWRNGLSLIKKPIGLFHSWKRCKAKPLKIQIGPFLT